MLSVTGVNFSQKSYSGCTKSSIKLPSQPLSDTVSFKGSKAEVIVEGLEFPTEAAKEAFQKVFKDCGQDKLVFRKSTGSRFGEGFILDTINMTDGVAGCATRYKKAVEGADPKVVKELYPWKTVSIFGHTFGLYEKPITLI